MWSGGGKERERVDQQELDVRNRAFVSCVARIIVEDQTEIDCCLVVFKQRRIRTLYRFFCLVENRSYFIGTKRYIYKKVITHLNKLATERI